jgi:hypothetical protein
MLAGDGRGDASGDVVTVALAVMVTAMMMHRMNVANMLMFAAAQGWIKRINRYPVILPRLQAGVL